MTHEETREALIAICETLKAEYEYLSSLQGRLVWLEHEIREALPSVAKSKTKVPYESHPGTVARIRQLDALLEKLGKL